PLGLAGGPYPTRSLGRPQKPNPPPSYSPDGSRLLTAGEDGMVRVWDAATGEPLQTLRERGPNIVHLGLGVLWSWRLGKGSANEREHLRHLVTSLPRWALVVADAGYAGYLLLAALQAAGLAFLIRLSARAPLYVPDKSTLKHYREGLVYYWSV